MQRGRGGRGDLFGFGDPFSGFGGFGRPGSLMSSFFGGRDPFSGFGGFGRPGSLMSSFFGGRDPFDDPFFTNPFGGMMGPSLFGPSMFGQSMLEPQGNLPGVMSNAGGFLEQDPKPSRPKGPIIKELFSDDEADEDKNKEDEKDKGNTRKHSRLSKEPYVEDPDEVIEEKRTKHDQPGGEYSRASTSRLHPQTFMFQSSTVTYGGPSGAYYTSLTTRSDGDGITVEENKEADTTTRKATHRISRGIGNKGHSVTRKLNSDGRVGTMQTLHNLNEDELTGFEETWSRNARGNFPGLVPRTDMLDNGSARSNISDEHQVRALPAPNQPRNASSLGMNMHSHNRSSKGRRTR